MSFLRKQESRNIPMEIDKTINKWCEQIKQNITGGKTYYQQVESNVDRFCGEVIASIDNYVQRALLLLNKGKILPAKALLRIISDVSIKCIWCLDGLKISEEKFNERFDKWRRCSLSEYRRLLDKELHVLKEEYGDEVSEQKEILKDRIATIESAGINKKERFNITEIVQEVWKNQPNLNMVALYQGHHEAVHPDIVLFERTLEESDNRIIYRGDIKEPPERIKGFCLIILGYLFETIYSVYKWDFSEFENDIKQLREFIKEK